MSSTSLYQVVLLSLVLCMAICIGRSYMSAHRRHLDVPLTLSGMTLICTLCAHGEEVPSFPVTFAATFQDKFFRTASAPASPEDPIPPVQRGHYRYRRVGATGATIRLKQMEAGIDSTLRLNFTHDSGGTLMGNIFEDGELVATQVGSFAIASSTEC